MRVLVVGCEIIYHDGGACSSEIVSILEEYGGFRVDRALAPKAFTKQNLSNYDVVAAYSLGHKTTRAQEKALLDFVRGGGGFVGVHCVSVPRGPSDAFFEMLGCKFKAHPKRCDLQVDVADPAHPLARRAQPFEIFDELYFLEETSGDKQVFLSSTWQGKPEPIAYTKTYGEGRVVYLASGHGPEQFKVFGFRQMIARSTKWAADRYPVEEKPIHIGLIGFGPAYSMGAYHSSLIAEVEGLEVTAVCDRDPARLEAAREALPGVATYRSTRDLLRKSDIGLAVVILPHNLHARVAVECLNAGRHVVVEKPMCVTVAEGNNMIDAAEKNERMLSVFHQRRFDGDFLTIRELIEKGAIGEVFQIEGASCGFGKPRQIWRSDKKISGGLLFDWGAHFLDWILTLMPGEIETVTGLLHKRVWHSVTNEDHGVITIRFVGGEMAQFEQSTIAAAPKPRWRILGTRGSLMTDERGLVLRASVDGLPAETVVRLREKNTGAYYLNIANHLHLGEPLVVKPEQARRVIAVLCAGEKSSKSGKAEPLGVPQ